MSTRDGGPFTAGTICPRCAAPDVHGIRPPNPDMPHMTGTEDLHTGGGTVRRVPVFDRWDERPYATIRTCTSCAWEWGQR